ncbi:hypothetical protein PRIPAC_93535 [Pristionchus pacificus]|uniref:Uncharacterized protein n=1 Tax=Pristionchus pacificus TaxID=54126 RepID=A0A2A6BP86_PRIPA|nr:hypothetical protein PRIPAC_93535 [Pristionchus pacificus]|eukprot:PDM67735.1 hypothetical protein PRIPAC_45779 [Pristionchus pacificus]
MDYIILIKRAAEWTYKRFESKMMMQKFESTWFAFHEFLEESPKLIAHIFRHRVNPTEQARKFEQEFQLQSGSPSADPPHEMRIHVYDPTADFWKPLTSHWLSFRPDVIGIRNNRV